MTVSPSVLYPGERWVYHVTHQQSRLPQIIIVFKIGSHQLDTRAILAPMAGVTDLPFRRLSRRLGAGMAVAEMITADTSLWHSDKSRRRLADPSETEPRVVQIAGSEPLQLAEAARCHVLLGAQVVDINMGCPAKKVCRKAAGSALLRDEKLVAAILRAVVAAVDVPVTLKIRTGWSPEQRNGVAVARIAEDAGIAALSVHGRTRDCRFGGEAEYDTIAAIVESVTIPVFANGDIDSPRKAAQVLAHTGAAAVMIGRASWGQPWLFREINHFLATGERLSPPTSSEWGAIVLQHVGDMHRFYGDYLGVRIARKHVGWYLDRMSWDKKVKKTFNVLDNPEQQLYFLNRLLEKSENTRNKVA